MNSYKLGMLTVVVDKASTLIGLGYQVIPVTSTGSPLIKGYMQDEYYEEDSKDWVHDYPDASLALVGGRNQVYALDFDVDDPKLARALHAVMKKHWPDLPFRKCNPPRFAVLFRASGELLDVKNAQSDGFKCKRFTKGDDKKPRIQQIEMIGGRLITLLEHSPAFVLRLPLMMLNPWLCSVMRKCQRYWH